MDMDSLYLPRAIFGQDFEYVYEPAEDTFLLLDALEKDLDDLRKNVDVCLECGSGSGTVITSLSKTLTSGSTSASKLFIATDINMRACLTTKKCALYHNQPDILVVNTNLAESLIDRLENQVDLLAFNPPYVPTEECELISTPDKPINLSWAGGKDGRKLVDTFLRSHLTRLLRKPTGVAYLVALDKNNVDDLLDFLVSDNIRGSVVMQRKAGIEMLF